jgi:hypothetical protein
VLLFSSVAALAFECGTLDHLDAIASAPRPPVSFAPPDGTLELRDPFDAGPNLVTTEHFAIRWGAELSFSTATVDHVALALEEIWDAEVNRLGWPQPTGTEAFKLNVYFGNSGGGTPIIVGASAYVTVDEQGYPYIVVSPDLLVAYDWGDTDSVPAVLAHEFMHTIQTTLGGFVYLDRAGWVWEASAEWVVPRVYPESAAIGNAVGAYALLPHVSVDHFDYPDEGTLIESHHYGAEVFLAYLTELAADDVLLKDLWFDSSPGDIPLESLAISLGQRDVSLQEAYLDFATRNVTFDDYAHGDRYAASTELFAQFYGDDDRRHAARVSRDGTDGWDEVPNRNRPWAYGYNHVILRDPPGGKLAVGVEAYATGTEGSPTTLSAALVVVEDEGVRVLPVLTDGDVGEINYTSDGNELYLVLVVAATPQTVVPEEQFGYTFRMEWTERAYAQVTGDGSDGPVSTQMVCGCNTGRSATFAWLGLLPLWWRRRR